ncbi:hypothetical protein [Leucobacter denitrificans]|uniref:Uncharacterized protein n=1 Tax=Leucobacter denitrificans TaxID=683042 RepID=A0A7G9S3D5_9MICO|nr:hypothetical protein [Leucobacter denitrificans]QNN62360.1 hypothetical protein H9L06_08825 [Leucobacter denitrificans]
MGDEEKPPQNWVMTSADFAKRVAKNRERHQAGASTRDTFVGDDIRKFRTGRITWQQGFVDFDLIKPSEVERSLFHLEKSLPVLVWNAAALGG